MAIKAAKTDREIRRRIFIGTVLSIVLLPVSAGVIYCLVRIIGPNLFGSINHQLLVAFHKVSLGGGFHGFAWSWETIIIVVYGVPHAILVLLSQEVLRSGRSSFRNLVTSGARLFRIVCVASVVFVIMLLSWRVLVEIIPDPSPPARLLTEVVGFEHASQIVDLIFVSFNYSFLCVLLEGQYDSIVRRQSSQTVTQTQSTSN